MTDGIGRQARVEQRPGGVDALQEVDPIAGCGSFRLAGAAGCIVIVGSVVIVTRIIIIAP
jgi:hypothetical protein